MEGKPSVYRGKHNALNTNEKQMMENKRKTEEKNIFEMKSTQAAVMPKQQQQ